MNQCVNHPDRLTNVVCGSCQSYYCPECLTEKDNKFICSDCDSKKTGIFKKIVNGILEFFSHFA